MKKVCFTPSLPIIALLLGALFLPNQQAQAQTNKKNDDLSLVGKAYHNVTSKYNGYFNADLLLDESIKKINTQHQDNYNQLLPMYEYVAGDAKDVEKDLDVAIKKMAIVLNLHKGSDWADDCYLLVGQSQFLKKDYIAAEQTLQYLVAEYHPDNLKNKGKKSKSASKSKQKEAEKKKESNKKKDGLKKSSKKTPPSSAPVLKEKVQKMPISAEDEKPEKYFLKKRPAFEEGSIWLAKTYIEQSRFDEAQSILADLTRNPKTPKSLKNDILEAQTYSFLKQKEYTQASESLAQLLDISKGKAKKARFAYILAQLQQQANQEEAAYASFERVLKYAPNYEMEFNARLSVLQNKWVTGKQSPADAIAALQKMLKDSKNKEYSDRIYYALSNVAMKQGDDAQAISYLQTSLKLNKGNKAQRAESFLQLADLYYKKSKFVDAKTYYDSTLMLLPTSDLRYSDLKASTLNLADIAKNQRIIQDNDSLLMLSKLDAKGRKEFALKMKKAKAAAQPSVKQTVKNNLPNLAGNSSFFAYDPKLVKKGQQEFIKKWGNRPLEDDWRRSNKRKNSSSTVVENTTSDPTAEEISKDEIAEVFKKVPSSPDQLRALEEENSNAYFALGGLYKEKLNNTAKSNEAYEAFLKNSDKHPKEIEALYALYLGYNNQREVAKANAVAQTLQQKYPNSNYAKMISDPNFYEEMMKKEKDIVAYYDKTYQHFQAGRYQETYDHCNRANELFGFEHALKPKFALLQAMSLGNLKGKDEYIKALQELLVKYPNTPEHNRAKEILRQLNASTNPSTKPEVTGNGDPSAVIKKESTYTFNDKEAHYMLIMLPANTPDTEPIKEKLRSYNNDNHKEKALKSSSVYMGEKGDIVVFVLRRFKNAAEAVKYQEELGKAKGNIFDGLKVEIYPVSQTNYREVMKQKNLDTYKEFFKQNYFK